VKGNPSEVSVTCNITAAYDGTRLRFSLHQSILSFYLSNTINHMYLQYVSFFLGTIVVIFLTRHIVTLVISRRNTKFISRSG
jgi:hypothetical protein